MSARSGLPCKIGDRHYLVDVEAVSWATVRPTRQGIDQSAGAGEASLSNEVVWRRLRDNWVGGAGQEYADLTDEEDPSSDIRFHTSAAVDCWTRRQFTLGKPLVRVRSRTGSGYQAVHVMNHTSGGGVWHVDGSTVFAATVDADTGVSSVLASAALGSTPIGSTSFGDDTLYFLSSTGAPRTAVRSGSTITVANFGSLTGVDMLAACGSRLLGADGRLLFEVLADGSKSDIYTHPHENFSWRGGLAMNNGIYVWGDVNGTGEFFLLPLTEATGELDAPIPTGELPVGETVVAVAPLVGVLVVGTSVGVRLLVINGDGSLTVGPSAEECGPVRGLASAGRFVYAATDTDPYIWRLDPGRFTDELLPAFAAECPVSLQPSSETVAAEAVTVTVAGSPTVVVAGDLGMYFYADAYAGTDLVAPSGSMDLGWFTFGIGEELSLDSVTVECDPTPEGSVHEVTVYVDTPSEEAVLEASSSFGGGENLLTAYASQDHRARRFRVRIALTADTTAGTAPVVREVVLRAAPAPHLSDEMILPIYLTDDVTDESGQRSGLSPWEEFTYLLGLRDSRERVVLELGALERTVRVEDVGVRSGGLGGGNGLDGWSKDGKWMKGRWDVRLVTVQE